MKDRGRKEERRDTVEQERPGNLILLQSCSKNPVICSPHATLQLSAERQQHKTHFQSRQSDPHPSMSGKLMATQRS